jgi:hypothetical protein
MRDDCFAGLHLLAYTIMAASTDARDLVPPWALETIQYLEQSSVDSNCAAAMSAAAVPELCIQFTLEDL